MNLVLSHVSPFVTTLMKCLGVDTAKTRSVTLNMIAGDIVTMDVVTIVREPGQEAVDELKRYKLIKEEVIEDVDETEDAEGRG